MLEATILEMSLETDESRDSSAASLLGVTKICAFFGPFCGLAVLSGPFETCCTLIHYLDGTVDLPLLILQSC